MEKIEFSLMSSSLLDLSPHDRAVLTGQARLPQGPPPGPMVFVALAHLAGLALGMAMPVSLWWPAVGVALCLGWAGWNYWRARRIHGPALGSGVSLVLALGLIGWWQGAGVARKDAE